jgi:hypothetical protein
LHSAMQAGSPSDRNLRSTKNEFQGWVVDCIARLYRFLILAKRIAWQATLKHCC